MEANPMNNEEFEVNGRIFIRSTYMDISVLIDKETGYYYAQKICDDNGKIMRDLERLDDYELMKQAVSATVHIPTVELEITFDRMPNGYRSKWVHKLLVNYIAQWANKEYAVKIAMLLNLIDERLKLENRTLQQEINSERRLVEQLQTDNGNLNRQVNELQQQNQTIIAQNNQLLERTTGLETQLTNANQQLDSINQQLDVANTKITRIGEHMTRFTDFIGDSLGEFNLTTASAKYVYLVLDRHSLVNEARDNHTIDANQYLFDSICCLKINRAKELRAHNYDEINDHIIIEYECSCSLDISKWIKRHFNENNCSVINTGRYIRKIRFNIGLRNEVIESIQRFLYRSQATKQTILEHIENMEDILEVQNTQLQELREQINQIRILLNEHRPNAVSVYSNGRYRELITQADGSIVYIPRAKSSEVELTEEDIRNLKFKDANGRFVNYKE